VELSAFESSGLINRLAIAQLSTGQFTEISVVSSETCPALLAAMVDCPSWMLRTIAKQPMILNPLMLTSGWPIVTKSKANPLCGFQLLGGARGAAMGIRYENRPVTPQCHKDCAFHGDKTLFDLGINRVQPGQVDRFTLIRSRLLLQGFRD